MHRVNPIAHSLLLLVSVALFIPATAQLRSRGDVPGLSLSPGGHPAGGPGLIGPSIDPGTGPSRGDGFLWDGPAIKHIAGGDISAQGNDPYAGFRQWDALSSTASSTTGAASPNIAVGLHRILVVTDESFGIFAKYKWPAHATGYGYSTPNPAKPTVYYTDFFAGIHTFGTNTTLSSSVALYDKISGRYIFAVLANDASSTGAPGTWWLIAVSDKDKGEPTGDPGNWHLYAIDARNEAVEKSGVKDELGNDGQYDQAYALNGSMGLDSKAVYFTADMYVDRPVGGAITPVFDHAAIIAVDRSGLLDGTIRMTPVYLSPTLTAMLGKDGKPVYDKYGNQVWQLVPLKDAAGTKAETLRVCKMYSQPTCAWLVSMPPFDSTATTTYLVVWSVSNALGSAWIGSQDVPVAVFGDPSHVKMSGLNPPRPSAVNAVYYRGFIYAGQTVPFTWYPKDLEATVRLFKVNVAGPAALVWYEWWGIPGTSYFYPTVEINATEDLAVSFGQMGSTAPSSPDALFTWRRPGDLYSHDWLPGRYGDHPFTPLDLEWGPYFGASLDAADPTTFWIIGQYGTSSGWGTHVRELNFDKVPDGTAPQLSGYDPTKQWTTTSTTIDITAQDRASSNPLEIVSGIFPASEQYYYTVDGGQNWYPGPVTGRMPNASDQGAPITPPFGDDGTNAVVPISFPLTFSDPNNPSGNIDSLTKNMVVVRVDDLTGNSGFTNPPLTVRIDTTPPGFGTPLDAQKNNTQTPTLHVPVQDVTSGLPFPGDPLYDPQYSYHRAGDPPDAWSDWLQGACTANDPPQGPQTLTAPQVPFNVDSWAEDVNAQNGNMIKFRMQDRFGNLGTSTPYPVQIDTVNPEGWTYPPSFDLNVATTATHTCTVQVKDVTSGLDFASGQYRIWIQDPAHPGTWKWGDWNAIDSDPAHKNGSTVLETLTASGVTFAESLDDRYQFKIADMIANETSDVEWDSSSVYGKLRVDTLPPTGWSSFSASVDKNSQIRTCSIQVMDATSGVDTSSAEYQYTNDTAGDWNGVWLPATCTGGDPGLMATITQDVTFPESMHNHIMFRVKDRFNNLSDPYQPPPPSGDIAVDTQPPTDWQNFQVTREHLNQLPTCTIQVMDATSGIDTTSAYYQYTTDTSGNWSGWVHASCSGGTPGQPATLSVGNVPFPDSRGNQIRFMVSDNFGHSSTSPDQGPIEVDTTAPQGWQNFTDVGAGLNLHRCTIQVQDIMSGLDPDNVYFSYTNNGTDWTTVRAYCDPVSDWTDPVTVHADEVPVDPLSIHNQIVFIAFDVFGNQGTSDPFDLGVAVSGTITPEGLIPSRLAGLTIPIDFRSPGTQNVIYSTQVTLDETGAYTAFAAPVGTYDVACKFDNWLRKVLLKQAITGPTTGVDLDLINGDADGSNKVGIGDLSVVLANYNTTGTPPMDGDLNWDGKVNLPDLSIILSNFNLSGD